MTEVANPAPTGPAPRLTVHGRYGADVGFELDSGSSLGVYLRRLPGSASHYADNEAVWLVWSDPAGRMQLQVPARVRHCDRVGVRVQFEAGQPPALIDQVLALVPRKTLADGAGPDPAERAVVLVVDAIRSDFVTACRALVDSTADALERADAPALSSAAGAAESARQLRACREAVEQDFRRRLTLPWRQPATGRETPAQPLANDGEMRAWLAGRVAARALERRCEPTWKPLRQWLRSLLDGRPGPAADALSVVAVIDALAQSLNAAELDPALQDRMLQLAGSAGGFELSRCYDRLAQSMQRAGIRDDRSPAEAAAPAAGAVVAVAPCVPSQIDPTQAWAALRGLGATPVAGVDPKLLAGGGAIADSMLLRAAGEVLAAPGGAADFRTRLEQRARQLSGNRRAALEWRQHEAIDLCVRLHGAIEDDPLVPAGFRERCRLLLKPLLAMELQGEAFDACVVPFRRLLALVEFASELCASRGDPATQRIRSALDAEIESLAHAAAWSAPELDAACERIDPLLQRARAASLAAEKRVLDACAGQQRMADARDQVQQAFARLFAGQQLPQVLALVLERRLATTLLPILLRAGPEGPEWRVAIGRVKLLHDALRQAAAGHPASDPERHLGWLREACAGPPDEPILARCLTRIDSALTGAPVPWVAFDDTMARGPQEAAATASDPRAAELAAAVRVGDWLLQQAAAEEPRVVKLAWRAADGSRCVFVNRLGQKIDELDAIAFGAALVEGSLRAVPYADSDACARAWMRVLAERHAALAAQATLDPVTGLVDRRELQRRLLAWLVAPQRTPLLLAWIQVDGLPAPGSGVEAELLGDFSALLLQHAEGCGYAARAAADAFVLVLQGLPPAQAERRAHACFEKALALPFELDGGPLPVALNMGLAGADVATASVERLLGDAQQACAAAQTLGRGQWQQHQADTTVLSRMRDAALWVRRIDEALPTGGLVLYGQRACALSAGEADYIEVLLRMRTSDGVVAPGEFAVAVERYGQIAAMDRHILQELIPALRRLAPGNRARIAFNISVRNLVDPEFVDEIVQTLRQQPVPLERLCVEVSALALRQQLDEALPGMRRLAAAGLALALEGFDANWSWRGGLEHLPFDVVKVPAALLRGPAGDRTGLRLVRSMNAIAHLLGKRTVAEQVADEPTLDAVRVAGFDHAQGYHLGAPLPLADLLN